MKYLTIAVLWVISIAANAGVITHSLTFSSTGEADVLVPSAGRGASEGVFPTFDDTLGTLTSATFTVQSTWLSSTRLIALSDDPEAIAAGEGKAPAHELFYSFDAGNSAFNDMLRIEQPTLSCSGLGECEDESVQEGMLTFSIELAPTDFAFDAFSPTVSLGAKLRTTEGVISCTGNEAANCFLEEDSANTPGFWVGTAELSYQFTAVPEPSGILWLGALIAISRAGEWWGRSKVLGSE